MYKVGEKVELDYELWTVKGIDGDMLQIENETGSRIVSACEVKRQSAHDKLLALGYVIRDTIIENNTKYDNGVASIYVDNEKKEYYCDRVNLELSRILTQYLEELKK